MIHAKNNNIKLSNFNSTIDKFFRQIDDSIPADMIFKNWSELNTGSPQLTIILGKSNFMLGSC